MGGGLYFEQNQSRFPNQATKYKQNTSSDESCSEGYDGTYI
jgi:hypothetical protein